MSKVNIGGQAVFPAANAVPKEGNALPTGDWGGTIPLEMAGQLAQNPEYAGHSDVQLYNDYMASQGQQQALGGSVAQQQATTDFNQLGSPEQPPVHFSGEGEINPSLTEIGQQDQDPVAQSNVEVLANLKGPDGTLLPPETVDELAAREYTAQGQRARRNDMARRIQSSEDLDSYYKEYDILEPTRLRAVNSVGGIQKGLNDVSVDLPDGTKTNGMAVIADKINEDYQGDPDNTISDTAVSNQILSALVRDGKILQGKANQAALPENASAFDKLQKEFNITPVDNQGSGIEAFHTQQGLVGIKEGTLGGRLLGQTSDAVKQARQSDTQVSFSPYEADVVEQALVDEGWLVRAPYTVLNKKGEASTKNKEVGQEHNALFMTRKYFDAIKSLKDPAELAKVGTEVQRVTTPDGHAFPEFQGQLKAKGFATPNATKEVKDASNKNDTVFTKLSRKIRTAYRNHDDRVNAVQGVMGSALTKYIKTPPAERASLPPQVQSLAKAYAKQLNIKPDELARLDPNATTEVDKANYYNATNKLRTNSTLVANAKNTIKEMPEGHRVGESARVAPAPQRMYMVNATSNEQVSMDHRGSLQGYDKKANKKLLEGKPDRARLLEQKDLNKLYNYIENGGDPTPDLEELAFAVIAMRKYYDQRNVPDFVLAQEFTVGDLKKMGANANAFQGVLDATMTPENDALRSSDPYSMALDANALGQVDPGVLDNALNFMMNVDHKSSGQQQQILETVADYINPTSKSFTINHLDLSDLSSGGRLSSAVHAGYDKGAQMVAFMGFMMDNDAVKKTVGVDLKTGERVINEGDTHEAFESVPYTEANPRMWSMRTMLDSLKMRAEDASDLANFNEADIGDQVLQVLTSALQTEDAQSYADDIFKLANMVLDYGMGMDGSTDAINNGFQKFLDKLSAETEADPNVPGGTQPTKAATQAILFKESNPKKELYYDIINISATDTLLEVANLGFAQSTSKMVQAAAMLGIQPVLNGYDGQLFPVGKINRPKIYGEMAIIKSGKAGGEVREAQLYGDTPVNDPGALAQPKYIEAKKDWSDPAPYSAVMQMLGPFWGHNTERAIISKGLNIADNRMNRAQADDAIIDGHDSLGLSPLRSLVFQDAVNTSAVRDVLKEGQLPRKTMQFLDKSIQNTIRELLTNGPDTMAMGGNTQWSDMLDYFDHQFKNLIKDDALQLDTIKNQDVLRSRVNRLKRTKNMLKNAMSAGLWSPDPRLYPVKGETILETSFVPSDKHRRDSFAVNKEQFARWYYSEIFKPAQDSSNINITHLGGDYERLVNNMTDPSKVKSPNFMKS